MKSRRLIEIVVIYPLLGTALILLVATAAVPFLSDGARTSETSAIGTLRSIASAEQAFRRACYVDMDGDGKGEFGTFRELSAGAPLRAHLGRQLLDPPLLSPSFHAVDVNGCVERSGFAFRLYLPARDGTWVCADRNDRKVSVDGAESRFRAFAWPLRRTERYDRVFCVDESGAVRATREPVEPATLHATTLEGWRPVR